MIKVMQKTIWKKLEMVIAVEKNIYTEQQSENYRDDGNQPEEAGNVMHCTDLEKVIILPQMETFKTAIFNKQTHILQLELCTNYQKKIAKRLPLFGMAPYINAVKMNYQFFLEKKDVFIITLWLENCSALNKNWLFLRIGYSSHCCSTWIIPIKLILMKL